MKHFKSPLIVAAALVVLSACERTDVELEQSETTSALSEAETSIYFDELDLITSEAVATAEAEEGRTMVTQAMLPSCAMVTHDAQTRTITIDFEGCANAAGNARTGKLIITRSGRITEVGGSYTATLENYTINGIAVEGARTVTNLTASSTATPQFSVVLRGGRIAWPDGTFVLREVDHLRSWVRASNPANDEWHISGTASGTNRQGQEYTSSITADLIFKVACRANGVFIPVQGTQMITRSGKEPLSLEYGNGNCDNDVLVSMGSRSRTITVERR